MIVVIPVVFFNSKPIPNVSGLSAPLKKTFGSKVMVLARIIHGGR